MITKLLLSGFFLFTLFSGFCQPGQNLKSEAEINSLYNKKLQISSNLYSGPQYTEQNYPRIGSPFFLSDTLTNGWISYDNHLYTNVPLQWDVFQNYILTQSLQVSAKLILRNDLIDSFYFSGHLIKYMEADKEHNLLRAGLYDILYVGKIDVISMRKKENRGIIEANTVYYTFTSKDKIYVKKEGTYYLVTNKNDVLRLFSQHSSAIKRLVRKAGLSWKKDFDQCVTLAARYYDNSTH